ncbi:hypothetical protein [Polaromonas sp. YR568]|uniref:hypothetical protein n=1 Tax=Polaromonas sp. YR568 TaxID=1855301 RepID=UPI00398BF089
MAVSSRQKKARAPRRGSLFFFKSPFTAHFFIIRLLASGRLVTGELQGDHPEVEATICKWRVVRQNRNEQANERNEWLPAGTNSTQCASVRGFWAPGYFYSA